MKGLVCLLLLLETFVCVVQHQVDGGLNENEISQQLRSEDGRQNPPQTDTLRDEASTDSQQNYHLFFTDIHAALRELTATVTEQKANIRELTATITEQKTNIRALETQLRDEMNRKNDVILEELNMKNYGASIYGVNCVIYYNKQCECHLTESLFLHRNLKSYSGSSGVEKGK
ncbi:hypothetical protein PO909_029613 [Leuciscus waleckii]